MLSSLLLLSLSHFAFSNPISPQAASNGNVAAQPPSAQGKPSSEGVTTFDGVSLANIKAAPAPQAVQAAAISRAGWTCVADSEQAGNPCGNALDGDQNTIWHTQYSPTVAQFPHTITVDMKQSYLLGSVSYACRTDGSSNGLIGQVVLSLSTDNVNFAQIAYGTFGDDGTLKVINFPPTNARYFRMVAKSEAGNRGPWTSAAEINAYTSTQAAPGSPAGKGAWTQTIMWPVIPVSLANIPSSNGDVLAWSSYNPSTFTGGNGLQTTTARLNLGSQTVTQALITNTGHDMFCEGLSIDANGRYISSGGNQASAVSTFDGTNWAKGPTLQIARGYQSQLTLSTLNTFTIGASWSGGQGGKNGEIYNAASNTWSTLSGTPVAPMLTADAQGVYRADNHAWLFAWKGGSVFQAGPSKAMNWYGTTGAGSQTGAGNRAADGDSMCGNAALYDATKGKILTAGGSPNYQDSDATSNAHIITITNPNVAPTVSKVPNMAYPRAFANSVVLPDGKTMVVGGQTHAVPFSDDTSIFIPELFNPATNTWSQLAQMQVPRVYHSTAILMPDATVLSAGGGLCGYGCATNHFDSQIFSPPYLYTSTGALATRPVINSVSVASVKIGGTFTATTNTAVTSWSLIRMSSTTHTVNTDQRRVPLTPTANGNTYSFSVPNDAGIVVPGYWMLFAMNGAGVPSVSKTMRVTLT